MDVFVPQVSLFQLAGALPLAVSNEGLGTTLVLGGAVYVLVTLQVAVVPAVTTTLAQVSPVLAQPAASVPSVIAYVPGARLPIVFVPVPLAVVMEKALMPVEPVKLNVPLPFTAVLITVMEPVVGGVAGITE